MSVNRFGVLLGVVILAVCLVFSITALTVLRNAIEETKAVNDDAEELLEDLQTILAIQEEESIEVGKNQSKGEEGFVMKLTDSGVLIFTADGLFVRNLDIDVSTLPETDRANLANGIYRSSWKEMLYLIDDFRA